MTLPNSGPLSMSALASEYGVANTTPLSGFKGKPGIPNSNPVNFGEFYGKSNFTLTASKTSIRANGYFGSDNAVVSSSVATTFTFTVTPSIGGTSRVTYSQSDSTHAGVGVTTPSGGNGDQEGTVRVTASNGDYIDISYIASWGSL